jgi:hypothetical protein
MIATQYEDPARREREEVYAVRRILIRRLQKATRGIPRKDRVVALRSFIAEWERLRTGPGMADLRIAAQQGGRELRSETPVVRAKAPEVSTERKIAAPARLCLQSVARMGQVDLFTPWLVEQP